MVFVGHLRLNLPGTYGAASQTPDMVKSRVGGWRCVRSRLAVGLVLLFLMQSWSALPLVDESAAFGDAWTEEPFRDVAVAEPFSHMSLSDYGDVAVVINNQSADSVTIGMAFAVARNIPAERILLLTNESTPTGETITSAQFTTYFADPISTMISERNLTDLNVLVTTKGVPLRVNGATNARAAFDAELALIDGPFAASIFADWYAASNYGSAAGQEMKAFSRAEQGYYLVTRLTGYDVETALGLIDKATASFGQHGLTVIDLATNRNNSGYKWWNDLLYATNASISAMGLPVHFNQNSTFVTDMQNVSMYTSWGSNDGAWDANFLPNVGFDTADAAWSSGARYWDGTAPALSPGEQWWWARQTEVTRNGNGAMEGVLDAAPCSASDAATTLGLQAEYFDNAGITYNLSLMPDLSGRIADVVRHEPNIDWAVTGNAWAGLDDRFKDYWSVRHTGFIDIPTSENWTFYLNSDDGTKLWIDGVEIVNHEGVHGMSETSDTVWLEAGEHSVRTEFYEHGGAAGFHLSWASANQTKQVIPTTAFTRGSSTPVRDADLIHHWGFDESSGDVAADSVGDADLNFTGTNGSQWRNCITGNCAFFDGVDDVAHVDVNDTVGDFTVSLWVKANHTAQGDFSSVIAVNDVAGDSESFQIMSSGGTPGNWQLYHDNRYDFGPVDDARWQHLLVAFTNNTAIQYLDGELVRTTNVSNNTINSIELYKFGVNRAGSTYFTGVIDEVQIWDQALTPTEIAAVSDEVVWTCAPFNVTANPETSVEQVWNIGEGMEGHAWILYGYANSAEDVYGEWWLEVEAFDTNGTLLSTNVSSSRALSNSWESRTVRFRPHENATTFHVRAIAQLQEGTRNGSVYFDTLNLRAIRPHFTWVDGAIAETAVSTGGRTFAWGADYGQSLVADLLEDGVSGVKGYVYEPYLSAIANPDQLFQCYAGGYTLAECYAASNVLLSWMGTVVGDPKMAAYADRLHDVNVSEVRAPETLSRDVEGQLEVLLENLAPGMASGHLEVRERQNNLLLASKTITLPGGNDAGSRRIVSVDVTPSRSGYVEFLVRWVADDSSQPERIVDNNQASLNIQVNHGPTIEDRTCSTTLATRGGVVTCEVVGLDDFGITDATLSWRYNGSIVDDWTVLNAASPDGGSRWVASITLPADAPLSTVDLYWGISDGQNLSAEIFWFNAFNITDATATWYGVHVEGADLLPWLGIDPPVDGGQGWIRGQPHAMTACVIDLDHDSAEESPSILVDGTALSGVSVSSTSGSQTCYQTEWRPPAGGALDPIQVRLVADGIEWSNRSLDPTDLPPTAALSTPPFLAGVADPMAVSLTDEDDPTASHSVRIEVLWPGAGLQNMTGSTITAPPGLEQGDATIRAWIDEGIWANRSWNWTRPVLLTPPILSSPVLCENGSAVTHLTRGEGGEVWVALLSGRQITTSTVQLSDGDSTRTRSGAWFEAATPTASCTPGAQGEERFLRLRIHDFDALDLDVGSITMRISLIDVDGLIGTSPTMLVELLGSVPRLDFSAMPTDLVSGEETMLIVGVLDSDGNAGTECSILLKTDDGITHLSAVFHPVADGVWAQTWSPPGRIAAGHTLSFSCIDAAGNQVTESTRLLAREAPPLIEEEENATGQGEQRGLGTIVSAAISVVLLLILAFSVIVSRRKSEEEEESVEDEVLPEEAWSKSEDDLTDEILAEMAGLESDPDREWTDVDLLEAGWSQDQIDAHRAEGDESNP